MNKNKISNKKLHQLKTVGIKEEIIEKAVNSNDEQCNNLNNNGSDSSDNDSKIMRKNQIIQQIKMMKIFLKLKHITIFALIQ